MISLKNKDKYIVGVISDTHGLLRTGVEEVFKGADIILHAGDIGRQIILETLQKIAPVAAVRGNMDCGDWAAGIPVTEIVEIGEVLIYMLHDLYKLDADPHKAGFNAVISGHTHRPSVQNRNGVLFLNPGSAGPKRHDYPISAALLRIQGTDLDVQPVEFEDI